MQACPLRASARNASQLLYVHLEEWGAGEMVERGKKEQGMGQCRRSKETRKKKSRGEVEEEAVKLDGKTDSEMAGIIRGNMHVVWKVWRVC